MKAYNAVLQCCIAMLYCNAVLQCCIAMLYCSAVLQCRIAMLYCSAVLQCCIAVLYCNAVLPRVLPHQVYIVLAESCNLLLHGRLACSEMVNLLQELLHLVL